MCELFCLSSRRPTRTTFSLGHFAAHGAPNTQPFARELGGHVHLFAHNGGLGGIDVLFARSVHRFHPVGDTDSERGFCLLLDRLVKIWEGASLDARLAVVEAFAAEMRPLGIANFLYSERRARLRPRPPSHAGRRGDGFRLSFDGGYQYGYISGGVGYAVVAPGVAVPGVPDLNNNFIPPGPLRPPRTCSVSRAQRSMSGRA